MAAILTAILCSRLYGRRWPTHLFPTYGVTGWWPCCPYRLSVPPFGTAVAKTARLGCHRPAMGTLHGLQLLVPLPLSGYGGFPRSRSLVPCLCGLAPRHPFLRQAFGSVWTTGLCLAGLYQIYTGIAQLAGWEPSHHYRYALTYILQSRSVRHSGSHCANHIRRMAVQP